MIDKSAWDLFLEISEQEKKVLSEYQALARSMGVEVEGFDTANPRHSSTAHLSVEQRELLVQEYGKFCDLSQKGLLALHVSRAEEDSNRFMINKEEIESIRTYHSAHLMMSIRANELHIAYLNEELSKPESTEAVQQWLNEKIQDYELIVSLAKAELARRGDLS